MGFEGVVESLVPDQISGWVLYRAEPHARPEPVTFELRLEGGITIAPIEIYPLSDARTGFRFTTVGLTPALDVRALIDAFDAVIARPVSTPDLEWRVPLFKSIMAGVVTDDRTTLRAARLREYSLAPKPDGKLAALTIVYNEHQMLPIWARYYASVVGARNLFVIDQGSDVPYTGLPEGVSVVRLPREKFDNWLIMRLVATFQRHLLESYDAVLYSDSDEFLCVAPEVLAGATLKNFLMSLPSPVGITKGFNLHHDILREPAIDPRRPILSQRRFLQREQAMDKPMISRIPLNWIPGFHVALEGGQVIPGMYMIHLRWFDLDAALAKGGRYRASAWDPFDVEHEIASYQREGEEDLLAAFRVRAHRLAQVPTDGFDENAEFTVVADWMRDLLPL